MAKSAPDGYTLLLTDLGGLVISASVYPALPFNPAQDFTPVAMVSYSPHVLAVNPQLPVKDLKELIALAKAQPDKLNFAISGISSAARVPAAPDTPTVAEQAKWAKLVKESGAKFDGSAQKARRSDAVGGCLESLEGVALRGRTGAAAKPDRRHPPSARLRHPGLVRPGGACTEATPALRFDGARPST